MKLDLMRKKKLLDKPDFEIDQTDADVVIKSRRRFIDPLFIDNKGFAPASSVSKVCKNIRDTAVSYGIRMYPLRLV